MIVGMYDTNGGAAVLPISDLAKATGYSVYLIRQALEGKATVPGKIFVKLPPTATWRFPPGNRP